ncbi:protein TsetseEP-like [Bactrocera tryoni]|uniref:protein TsetseEP-like n=1 Tax=Bactrocera tryoni TaxID=59916 RepID=UPI001A96B94F|nr:protein TsetseEP-like [Bactrocera tryoni]
MQPATLAIFALALIGTTVAGPHTSVARAKADNAILNLLAESNLLGSAADPAITTECFNHFMPILNQISTNFSLQYEQCVSLATQATANLTTSAAQGRATFVNETTAMCSAFTSCNSDSDNLDFFNCYAAAASADVNEIYNLSADASNAAISLKGELQQIKNTEKICTNNAQLTYTEQTSETYKELNACFVNGLPIATTVADN